MKNKAKIIEAAKKQVEETCEGMSEVYLELKALMRSLQVSNPSTASAMDKILGKMSVLESFQYDIIETLEGE